MSEIIVEKPCWFFINSEPLISYKDVMTKLKSKDIDEKVTALEMIIESMINDETLPDNLMITVIHNCTIDSDIRIKKLLLLFWEAIEKKNKTGKLREEFLLVCNSLRKDLTHPNEFIRGRTLRLLSKLPYQEILESLKSVLFENLTHKHPYVRSNALQTTLSIVNNFGLDVLPPNTVEKIKDIIAKDSDIATRRSAYITLSKIDPRESLLITRQLLIDNETNELSDLMILSIIENIYQLSKIYPNEKSKLIKFLIDLSNHKSNSVNFEIASKLIKLTTNPNIIRTAVQLLCNLLVEQKDNNTLIVILKILQKLKNRYKDILEEQIISFAAIISSTLTQELRVYLFEIISDLIKESNISSVFDILIKNYESVKFVNDDENINEFKNMIILCFYSSIIKFPNVKNFYWFYLLEKCLHYSSTDGYVEEHIYIIKSIFKAKADLVSDFIQIILKHFEEIVSSQILLNCIWILANYSNESSLIISIIDTLMKNIGDLNLEYIEDKNEKVNRNKNERKVITKTVIKEDGTYGTETIVVDGSMNLDKQSSKRLRSFILETNFFFATNIAVYLTKLIFMLMKTNVSKETFKVYYLNALTLICALYKIRSTKIFKDQDNLNRINLCLNFLIKTDSNQFFEWLSDLKIFEDNAIKAISAKESGERTKEDEGKSNLTRQVDDAIIFRHVRPFDPDNLEIIDDGAIHDEALNSGKESSSSKKEKSSRTVQVLTGSEDLILVEASIELFTFDIVIEFIIKNKTKNPLQNIQIDLFTPNNLEVIERAPHISLGPFEHKIVRSCIKFSVSCNAYIFGQINFADAKGKPSTINLSGIFVDLLNTHAANINESLFRKLWVEYNWEQYISIMSKKKSFRELIEGLCNELRLRLIIPSSLDEINEDSLFLVANLYTRTKLGEDALVNISVEKSEKKIIGNAIIRSKVKEFTQYLSEKIKDKAK